MEGSVENYIKTMDARKCIKIFGRVSSVKGIVIEATIRNAQIGELCTIHTKDNCEALAEVVGFTERIAQLLLLSEAKGLSVGALVKKLGCRHKINVSPGLLGNKVDGFGRPLSESDKNALWLPEMPGTGVDVFSAAPLAVERPCIEEVLPTKIRAIDACLTAGKGQRLGVFSGAGCGKTTLLAEIMRNAPCDVIVLALIGERGREVNEFLLHEFDETLRSKTVLVCATSDKTSMERARAAYTATAIAEGYRDQTKDVLLVMDSVTRFARAQREIGIAIGEPIGASGLPASVYTALPALVERTGLNSIGSITAFYSVLIEQDKLTDPIGDEIRSLIDGHIILSRKLAHQGHFPAIDINKSLSRVMSNIVDKEHQRKSEHIRKQLSCIEEVEFLLQVGEYKHGCDEDTDQALNNKVNLNCFLQQRNRQPVEWDEMQFNLDQITREGMIDYG